ncbi:MAG TPA: APC family permease [Solirubrobacteraceae bacterium]|jgi:amino acid transporter|nr:APC family permease [Solirubrobacteraceae bacterium]
MEATSVTGPAAPGREAPRPQLKKGAIGYVTNIVVGVASTAPAYSLAATVGFFVLTQGVGVHSPAVIIVSFLPMVCIAWAYKYMNEVDPDCGTSFSWVSRALGPSIGWVIGWTVLFSDIVVNANQAQIAGSYGFQLFGLNTAANTTLDVTILGVIFIVLLTWICWKGIELSARTQQLLLGFEMTILIIFAVVALIKAYNGSNPASLHVQADWFNPFSMSAGSLVEGMLLGVFLYWGWDTSVSVNEESENSATGPGRAAVVSTVILIGIYLLVTVAAQSYAGTKYLANNPNDIFAGGLSKGVLGGLHFLLIISVLTSATAATQTTILPAARQALSMARRGAIPDRFAEIHERNLIPGNATIWAGALSVVWYVFIVNVSTNVLGDCVAGLGFLVCTYYGFTGFACTWFYRHQLTKSVKNFVRLGFVPTFGGAVLMLILVRGAVFYGHEVNDYSPPFLGLGVPDWIGILGIGSGIILMLVQRARVPGFWRREKRLVYGDPIEVVTPEAEFAPADSML